MRNVLITAAGDGAHVFSVADIQPPQRYSASGGDPGVWTRMRVQEATSRTGPWQMLGETAIVPVDSDPERPEKIRVTVRGANYEVGWYTLELLDADENVQPLRPMFIGVDWKPSTRDVARLLRGRAHAGGGRVPDFLNETDDRGPTDPSRDEVLAAIDDAASDIYSTVAFMIPDAAGTIAQTVCAIGAALLVEIGSEDFDEQRYDRLEKLYDTRLAQLLDAVQDLKTGGEIGNADDRVTAVGSFPPAAHSWDHVAGSELPCDPRRWGC